MPLTFSAPAPLEHGDQIGSLKILHKVKKRQRGRRFLCGCVCGRLAIFKESKLRQGKVTSCGVECRGASKP